MTLLTSLRIDAPIQPVSRIRLMFHLVLATALLTWAALASLALWQYVTVLIVSATALSYLALSRPILLHLSQPPSNKSIYQHWQLLMRSSRGDSLSQAELVAVSSYSWVICFKFIIKEPYQRPVSVAIFRDQVSAEQWRKLSILANSVSAKTA
ncbi:MULTISPECIES: hypothetical protein [unclassified Psychrobacter]|uniref:hypothetical protein n=1 Tax=unclassified Psychrobacter TaxID=196806 RepID=UPI0025E0142F|nr:MULTISPECIES: hypothetical protein [unclassified Psychrobacter]